MAPTIYEMLANLAESMSSMNQLGMVFSYITGLSLIMGALYKLRTYGDFRVMMMQGVDLKGPFGSIVFGTLLVWLPSSLEMTSATLWGVGEPIGYDPHGSSVYDEGIAVALSIVEFVGLIAFIRGLIIMARVGQQSGQPGTLAKGLTHIVGGILAYHIGATIDVIMNTFSI